MFTVIEKVYDFNEIALGFIVAFYYQEDDAAPPPSRSLWMKRVGASPELFGNGEAVPVKLYASSVCVILLKVPMGKFSIHH